MAGTQQGDIYAGKVANSLSLGLFAIVYSSYMLYKKDDKFVQTWNALTKIFVAQKFEPQSEHQQKVEQTGDILKAVTVSFICGLFNAVGMTSLYIAFSDAAAYNLNISVCTAILSGNCIFGLFASLAVFKDKITIFQTLGVFINLGGVLIISFGQGAGGATPIMVAGSAVASFCLGMRIILSRYCTDRLDSLVFMNINFIAELLFGIGWILIAT